MDEAKEVCSALLQNDPTNEQANEWFAVCSRISCASDETTLRDLVEEMERKLQEADTITPLPPTQGQQIEQQVSEVQEPPKQAQTQDLATKNQPQFYANLLANYRAPLHWRLALAICSRQVYKCAAKFGCLRVVKAVMAGSSRQQLDARSLSKALNLSISQGRLGVVQFLLDQGVQSSDESPPWVVAASAGHVEVMNFILDRAEETKHTERMWAGYFADDQPVVDIANAEDGFNALLAAAGAGHLEVVRSLVNRGADVNYQTPHGWTAVKVIAFCFFLFFFFSFFLFFFFLFVLFLFVCLFVCLFVVCYCLVVWLFGCLLFIVYCLFVVSF